MEIFMNELTNDSPYELEKDLKFIKEIDQGAFGKVIYVKETKKELDLAVKVINKAGAGTQLIQEMKEEISILKKLDHENIVKFYGYSETNNQLLIKMEYIKYGTLSSWMKEHRKITEAEASLILSKVLSAVEYLHNMKICHRDIKPENIMISKENDLASIKIIDFGLSAQQFNYLSNNEYCGTFIYMAPEQIEKKLYCFSVDIWSIGILMYMLLNNGKHPFFQKGDKKEDLIKKIKEGKLHFINKMSYMAKNLNHKLCEPNPSWRYSAKLAKKHPWITRNPYDEIPLTLNEILSRNNCKKNAYSLIMISILLNYYNKKEIHKRKNELNNGYDFDNYIKKKKMKNKLFVINKEYIHNCNIISKREKEKQLKKKEKYLEVLSTDEEDSYEKRKAVEINIRNNKLSQRKSVNCSEIIFPIEKQCYVKERSDYPLKNIKKQIKTNNLIFDKDKIIHNKCRSNIKDKNKLYLVSVPNSILSKKKSNEIKIHNRNNINNINNINKINSNHNKRGSNCKSISKFYIYNDGLEEDIKSKGTPEKNIKSNKAVRPNLPYVLGNIFNNKNNVHMTDKKYHNNYMQNCNDYNIIPLILPFIGIKQEEKRNIMI